MDNGCDIPEDVRHELGLVHADVGTYIDLDRMRSVGYASLDYEKIFRALEDEIRLYNFNYRNKPPTFPAKECTVGEVATRTNTVSVVKCDFYDFLVNVIDDDEHVMKFDFPSPPSDSRHAIQAIIAQLWNVVITPSIKARDGSNSRIVELYLKTLFEKFEDILSKHAAVAARMRRALCLSGLCTFAHSDRRSG